MSSVPCLFWCSANQRKLPQRFVKTRLWARGLRFLDKSKPLCINIVKDAIKDILRVTDPDYIDELFPWFCKLFMERLNKRADNIKSKYRADVTQLCEQTSYRLRANRVLPASLTCHFLLLSVKDDMNLEVPTHDFILDCFAMGNPSGNWTDEQKTAMRFFLNVAVPAVDPAVTRKTWLKKKTTHMLFFGDSWAVEMATALVLLAKFSDLDNLRYNAGLTDEHGNSKDNTEPPEKKRRKKMHTRQKDEELSAFFFKTTIKLNSIRKRAGFEADAKAWDDECCDKRGKDTVAASSRRVNIVPEQAVEPGLDSESLARDFLRENNLFEQWSFLDDLSSGSSSPDSTGGMPPLHPPITQESAAANGEMIRHGPI